MYGSQLGAFTRAALCTGELQPRHPARGRAPFRADPTPAFGVGIDTNLPIPIARLAQGAELTGDIKRLQGSHEYRLRVGDWRVRFERDDQHLIITIVRVLPRGRAYDR